MVLYVMLSLVKFIRLVGCCCSFMGSLFVYDMMNWFLNYNIFKKDVEVLKFNCYSLYYLKRIN